MNEDFMYQTITTRAANRLTSGGQIITVATTSKDGVADVMTAAWNCPYDSDQVLVVLDLGHTTTKNILETGKFVVAIPSNKQIYTINKVGSAHGRDTGDKFVWAKADSEVSPTLGIKVLKDCLAYIECELTNASVLEQTGVCLGKAVNIYVKEGLWDDVNSSFAEGLKQAVHYIKEDQYLSGGDIITVSENYTNMN